MGTVASVSQHMNYTVFLNVSFLVLLLCAALAVTINFQHSESLFPTNPLVLGGGTQDCEGLQILPDNKAKCLYLKSKHPCFSPSYIDYLYLFYCTLGGSPLLGHSLLFLWVLVLFYLSANTASEYFCPSLESLSKLLKLSPTIAGVTLLSLGNGANDVFASLVSFKGGGTRGIGINTVIGGAFFVSCVVVGIISISVRSRRIRVCKFAHVRDVCFFLIILLCLIAILVVGKISVVGAIEFALIYVAYVIVVCVSSTFWEGGCEKSGRDGGNSSRYDSDLSAPILGGMEEGLVIRSNREAKEFDVKKRWFCAKSCACEMLEMPLYLPRRLTIPVVCEERWSKAYAVASVTLAPILLSVLWNSYKVNGIFSARLVVYVIGLLIGVALGALAYLKTESSSPPKKCLFPWLAGGFVMSVTWSYITAQELVGLLISLGYICRINPSILGLTVLAWGNSLGDLITNLTMALKGGPEGTQVAISGCYAGPIFNTLVGLGFSLVWSSWLEYPSSVIIPKDPYLLWTMGFLVGALLWTLAVLPRKDMRLDGVLGGGLLVVYFISLFLRFIQTFGSPVL